MPDVMLAAIEPHSEGQHIWRVAHRVAGHHSAEIRALNVVRPAVSVYADLDLIPMIECTSDWQAVVVNEHRRHIASMTPQMDEQNLQIVEGRPGKEIVAAATELSARLIVMGVHNRRGLRRLMGSTTHDVLNHSSKDVLAVHPDSSEQAYSHVMIAVDTSDLAAEVMRKAAEFVAPEVKITLVSVVIPLESVFVAPDSSARLNWTFTELHKDIERETRSKIFSYATEAGLGSTPLELPCGDPRDELVSKAAEIGADLIVIGSSGRGPLGRLLVGSTAQAVLNKTSCDVLVCQSRRTDT